MNRSNLKLTTKVYVAIACLGFLNSVIYSIPYIKAVFYDGMIELTGATNAQLGAVMTIYGLGEVITLGFGGLLAERFDYKKIILISSIFTGVGCFILAFWPSLMMVSVVWFILVFSSLFMFWGSMFKALRMLGSDEVQGKITGFYYGIAGVGYFLVNVLLLYIYDLFGKGNAAAGMQAVFICLGILSVISCVIAFVALKYVGIYDVPEKENVGEPEKELPMRKQFAALVREPGVWYFGGTLFCVYSMTISIQYFTPYFTDVLGVTVVFGGFLAILRQYGMQAIGSPVGGIIADKIGSSAKVVLICSAFSAVTILAVLVFPNWLLTVGVLTVIMLLAAWFNGLNYGIQYAIVSEAKISRELTSAAVGMGSMIGFIPDVFQHTMFGIWMDKYGQAAYTYIFLYGIVVALIGVFLLGGFLRYKKKKEGKLQTILKTN